MIVPNSPFNQLKLMLIVLALGGALVILLASVLAKTPILQLELIVAYSLSASAFLVYKTYQVLKILRKTHEKIQK